MIKRDLVTTIVGIGAGQAIVLCAMPILARTYSPEAFGEYAVIVAVSGVIATIAALRYDLALTGASDPDIPPLVRIGLLAPFLVVPASVGVLALLLSAPIAREWTVSSVDLPLIGLIALIQGLTLVGSSLSTRLGAFGALAVIKIAQPLIFVVFALFFIPSLPVAMAIGWAAALLASGVTLTTISWAGGAISMRDAGRRAWRFPTISAPMAMLDVLALALPLLFIASRFGEASAGNYSQVQRLVGAPLTLVAVAAGQIFYKYAGDLSRSQQPIMPLVKRFLLGMTLLCAFAVFIILLIGHPALSLLIGSKWRTDTGFIILALLPVLCRVVGAPVSAILVVTNRIGTGAAWQISYFVATLTVLWLGQRFLSFEWFLGVFAASEFVMYSIYLWLSIRAATADALPDTEIAQSAERRVEGP